MTRATEFCDQHGLMPLYPFLKWQGPRGSARKAEGFFKIVEPLQFAVRSAFAKQDERDCSDAVTQSQKLDPKGISGVRLIDNRIDPPETGLSTPMQAD